MNKTAQKYNKREKEFEPLAIAERISATPEILAMIGCIM